MADSARFEVGDGIVDVCHMCKTARDHTVEVADGSGRPLRVTCDHCGAEHPYRGGTSAGPPRGTVERVQAAKATGSAPAQVPTVTAAPSHAPPTLSSASGLGGSPGLRPTASIEEMVRRVIREELGTAGAAPAERWQGGELVLRPGKSGVQEKSWPIDAFFSKIIGIRNRLRVLEQHINAADEIPTELKLKLQSYITASYGSLTSFNLLFADPEDRFKGSSKGD